ncbi:MAG: TolC family protein [Bacteroidales bacterium]|nr:TolC family protein [Bacteroidales bacterium]
MRKLIILLILTALCWGAMAQQVLTLEECHQMALEANYSMKRAEEKKIETEALEKVALWQMLPKVSANGAYMWMDKNIHLLSQEQQDRINNLGTTAQGSINNSLIEQLSGLGLPSELLESIINGTLNNTRLETTLNGVGHDITSAMQLDMSNVMVGTVTVTQPIYLGGKLRAAYRTTQMLNELSGIQYDKQRDDLLLQVDEAYWQVVSVTHKKALAEQYAQLLRTLNGNVEEMVAAEMATQGDLAQVRVKLNEAEMQLTNATNGLVLAKMLLAQRCGMPLNTDFEVVSLARDDMMDDAGEVTIPRANMDSVWAHRAEMKMLRISDTIAQQGVRMAASSLKPNIVATGGYLATNPNMFDGFKNEFNGTLTAGVAVNIPIFHPGGAYAVKAAKAKRREIGYQMKEAEEMIELQVEKTRCELELSYKKKVQAESNLAHAEENLRLADESYKSGMCSSSDLMAAQTAWMKAEGEVIDATIEIELGKTTLRMMMGE